MSLPAPTTLSPSKINAFKACPLAFRFAVIDRLPEPPSPAACRGTLVHRALELLMGREPSARTAMAARADLERAAGELAATAEFAGLAAAGTDHRTLIVEAEALLDHYFALEDPTSVRAIGLELFLTAHVDGITLRGIIDRLELDADGELVVTDYKTGRAPRAGFEAGRFGAVHLYALLCERVLGRRPVRVQLMHLAEPELISLLTSDESLRFSECRAVAIWAALERACEHDDFRPSPGPLCDGCAFRAYCPAFGGDPTRAVELRPGLLATA